MQTDYTELTEALAELENAIRQAAIDDTQKNSEQAARSFEPVEEIGGIQ